MKGYQKIYGDIFGDSGYHLAPYPKKNIPGYPCISKGYPKKVSHHDILQCYPLHILSYPNISFSNIPMISNIISKKDLQRISLHWLTNPDIST
jgi:hypothetical protein